MSKMDVLLLSVAENTWIPLGPKPFKGLANKGSIIELDKNGQPYLYRVISAHPPVGNSNGAILIKELGSKQVARENLFRDAISD